MVSVKVDSLQAILDRETILTDSKTNPGKRDKCLSQIIFLQKNKEIICKAKWNDLLCDDSFNHSCSSLSCSPQPR